MAKFKGIGVLRHGFYGNYVAVIGLQFENEKIAAHVLPLLGKHWRVGEKEKRVLVASVGGEDLDLVKAQLDRLGRINLPCGYYHCVHQCKNEPIDNVNHSIDMGAQFEVTIECEPIEQTSLFQSS
jgi:hypothetical protein